jgi:hypothetical protein
MLRTPSPRAPGFLVYLEEGGKRIAWGRSLSQVETSEAIQQWLLGSSLDALYNKFEFLDKDKRNLLDIKGSVLKEAPVMGSTVQIELKESREWSALWFSAKARSVVIDGSTREALFRWDQGNLFRSETGDRGMLAKVINSWLCDEAAPSLMRRHFPELKIGKLADYYESGNPVEGEFLQSWDETERFVGSKYFEGGTLVLPFIAELRKAGYDRKLRIGLSHGRPIILSRSRYDQLRDDQPHIILYFHADRETMTGWVKFTENMQMAEIPIAFSGEIEQAFVRLAAQEIT